MKCSGSESETLSEESKRPDEDPGESWELTDGEGFTYPPPSVPNKEVRNIDNRPLLDGGFALEASEEENKKEHSFSSLSLGDSDDSLHE